MPGGIYMAILLVKHQSMLYPHVLGQRACCQVLTASGTGDASAMLFPVGLAHALHPANIHMGGLLATNVARGAGHGLCLIGICP